MYRLREVEPMGSKIRSSFLNKILFLSLALILSSCARTKIKERSAALKIHSSKISFNDEGEFKNLISSIEKSHKILKRQKNRTMVFGPHKIKATDYAEALELLLKTTNMDEFKSHIDSHFSVMAVYGSKSYADILLTAYYEPVLKGYTYKKGNYYQPIYKVPSSLIEVDIQAFASENIGNFTTSRDRIAGRIVNVDGKKRMVPFFSREEIDSKKTLPNRYIMAYVDPVEAFFLHIQGSGTIQLQNKKEIRVGYAAQNGHRYYPIGKELLDVIPIEDMSLQKIEEHLRNIPKSEKYKILNTNPSYIFFRKLDNEPETSSGATVTAMRTLAVDRSLFPLGALTYMEYEAPDFSENTEDDTIEFKPTSGFLMAQDTGGAIKGPARADLFWGKGETAKRSAGVMKNRAKLYFLAPKNFIETDVN
ncbi:MAG: MltA domain-containing protein [Bdellovibrionales bacterium]